MSIIPRGEAVCTHANEIQSPQILILTLQELVSAHVSLIHQNSHIMQLLDGEDLMKEIHHSELRITHLIYQLARFFHLKAHSIFYMERNWTFGEIIKEFTHMTFKHARTKIIYYITRRFMETLFPQHSEVFINMSLHSFGYFTKLLGLSLQYHNNENIYFLVLQTPLATLLSDLSKKKKYEPMRFAVTKAMESHIAKINKNPQ